MPSGYQIHKTLENAQELAKDIVSFLSTLQRPIEIEIPALVITLSGYICYVQENNNDSLCRDEAVKLLDACIRKALAGRSHD
jgi:hypothetical protein